MILEWDSYNDARVPDPGAPHKEKTSAKLRFLFKITIFPFVLLDSSARTNIRGGCCVLRQVSARDLEFPPQQSTFFAYVGWLLTKAPVMELGWFRLLALQTQPGLQFVREYAMDW